MEFDSVRRLRTSTSRNFSRPFPSPLSTGALNTPTRISKSREFLAQFPLSASHGNSLRAVTSRDYLATNRLIDFTGTPQSGHPATSIAHSNTVTWHTSAGNKSSNMSCRSSASSSSLEFSVHDEVGADSPIHNFRPGLWRLLERDREIVNLDLFWPIDLSKTSDEQDGEQSEDADLEIFPYDGLRPLITFRNLHTLHLTGMVRSYQPLIWATCWLNPNLTTLHLEMALEPLLNISSDIPYRQIDASWTLKSPTDADEEPEYLGHHGTGVLHEEFGDGEYLDTQAIKMAQLDAADELPQSNMRYLPIKKLTLMNFVVDAWPTLRWFDPKRLEEIVFKTGCADAGFYLPFGMMHVKVQAPHPAAGQARVVKVGELKIVDLKKGKIVSRKDAVTRKEELGVKPHPTLRHKISQIFPRMVRRESIKRNKENKAAVVEPQNAKVNDETGFNEMEIRAARDGKKPAR